MPISLHSYEVEKGRGGSWGGGGGIVSYNIGIENTEDHQLTEDLGPVSWRPTTVK